MITCMKKSKLFIFCLILNCSLSIIAMEKLTFEDRQKLLHSIGSLRLKTFVNPSIFGGESQGEHHFINDHTRIIEGILDSHSITHPEEMTSDWLENLKQKLEPKKNTR